MLFFTELEEIISQFVWKHTHTHTHTHTQKPRIAKASLKKKNGTEGINLSDFRLYCKATVINTVWYWHRQKYRSMEQNRKFRDKIHIPMDTLSFTKEAKIYNGEKTISLTSGAGKADQPCVKG